MRISPSRLLLPLLLATAVHAHSPFLGQLLQAVLRNRRISHTRALLLKYVWYFSPRTNTIVQLKCFSKMILR
jgi:hypothetical protein